MAMDPKRAVGGTALIFVFLGLVTFVITGGRGCSLAQIRGDVPSDPAAPDSGASPPTTTPQAKTPPARDGRTNNPPPTLPSEPGGPPGGASAAGRTPMSGAGGDDVVTPGPDHPISTPPQ